MDLGLEIRKNIVAIRTGILEVICMPIFKQNERLFQPKFVLGLEIDKNNGRIKVSILKIFCVPIFRKNK